MSEKGDELFASAQRAQHRLSCCGLNRERNNEDAAELYIKAAAAYKVAKEFAKAGTSYEKAADCLKNADNEIESNQSLCNAGKAWAQVDSAKAVECYKGAVEYYLNDDKFDHAAKLMDEIGDMLAEDDEKLGDAIKAFETSAEYFESDNDQTNANKRLLKIAMLSARDEDYNKAIPIFEKNAKFSADNNLLKWKVKDYLFQAMLCQLAKACSNNIKQWSVVYQTFESYKDISNIFTQSREAKLIEKLIPAIEKSDLKAYKFSIEEHEHISPLDHWSRRMLLQCENHIRNQLHLPPDLINEVKHDDNNNNNNNNNNDNNTNTIQQNDPFSIEDKDTLQNAPEL